MGDVKQNMLPTDDDDKGFMSKWKSKKKTKSGATLLSGATILKDSKDAREPAREEKRKDRDVKSANNLADHVLASYEAMGPLIESKTADISKEKGREAYNGLALAKLTAIRFHLSEIIDIMEDYGK
jgi:hypothetical protein